MGRIGRSFELVRQSYGILMQDKELMILPLISGIVTVGVCLSFFVGFDLTARIQTGDRSVVAVPVFLMYVAVYAVGIYFQAAVIAGATERIRGGDPTIGSALSAASRHLGSILLWALIAATFGILLRALRDRSGFLGRIVIALAGAAWSLGTFFVVPIIILEDLPVGEALSESVEVFRKTWGETFVGSTTLGAAAVCAWLTLVALVGLLAWAGLRIGALAVGAAGAILLAVLFSALQGVFVASLYQFATAGATPRGFDRSVLAQAFAPKAR